MSTQQKILFTIPNFITAGSGGAMLNIVERLDPSRWKPAVCVLKKGGEMEGRIERQNIEYLEAPFAIPVRPYVSLLPRCWRVARKFRSQGISIWHSFHYSSDYTEPIIARMSGAKAWIFTKKNMGWSDRAWKVRSFLATRIAAQNSDMLKNFFSTDRLRQKTVLLPRGVDTNRFKPNIDRLLGLRSKLGIEPNAFVATVVAQLVPIKRHPIVLSAVAKVPNAHLWVAGNPLDMEYTQSLKRQVSALHIENRVHFLGGIRQVPELLAESDAFVLPTSAKGEGCPVALMEAMSCGCACIATSIPGSKDLIETGRSGLLVDPEDVEGLAAALMQIQNNLALRHQLGTAARQRVLDHYSIEREVEAHESLYMSALESRA